MPSMFCHALVVVSGRILIYLNLYIYQCCTCNCMQAPVLFLLSWHRLSYPFSLQEGAGQSGIEDLASGLIGASYYLGGGAGPIVGGAITSLVGFEWASTSYGLGLLLLSSILAVTLLVSKRRRQNTEDKLHEPLLD